jgi:hypothetical protein
MKTNRKRQPENGEERSIKRKLKINNRKKVFFSSSSKVLALAFKLRYIVPKNDIQRLLV